MRGFAEDCLEAILLPDQICYDLICFLPLIDLIPLHLDYIEVLMSIRSSRPELFLQKGVLKIYSKFTGEHPCRTAASEA